MDAAKNEKGTSNRFARKWNAMRTQVGSFFRHESCSGCPFPVTVEFIQLFALLFEEIQREVVATMNCSGLGRYKLRFAEVTTRTNVKEETGTT